MEYLCSKSIKVYGEGFNIGHNMYNKYGKIHLMAKDRKIIWQLGTGQWNTSVLKASKQIMYLGLKKKKIRKLDYRELFGFAKTALKTKREEFWYQRLILDKIYTINTGKYTLWQKIEG